MRTVGSYPFSILRAQRRGFGESGIGVHDPEDTASPANEGCNRSSHLPHSLYFTRQELDITSAKGRLRSLKTAQIINRIEIRVPIGCFNADTGSRLRPL